MWEDLSIHITVEKRTCPRSSLESGLILAIFQVYTNILALQACDGDKKIAQHSLLKLWQEFLI